MQPKLEDLHRRAASHYLKGEFDAARAAWEEVLRAKPDDERAREGVRLCGQAGSAVSTEASAGQPAEHASVPVADAAVTEAAVADDPFPDEVWPPGDTRPDEPEVDGSAAQELEKRVEALLSEAAELMAQDRSDEALRALDRVLILDEENEQALRMQAQLDAEFEESRQADELPPEDLGADPQDDVQPFDLDLGPPDDAPGLALDDARPAEPAPEAAMPFVAEDEQPVPGTEDVPVAPPEPAVAETPAPAPPTKRPGLRLSDRRVLIGVGAALLLVVGFVTMRMLGGGEAPPGEQPVENSPRAAQTEEVPDTPVSPPQAAAPGVAPAIDVAALVREAETAFESGNYAAAVIAYDKVLKYQPESDIRAKLNVAAQRYREQQALQARWDEAVHAFEEGSYAEALRLFYRMSKSDYEADLDGFKVNGWYNLGLNALKSNDCNRAAEHFEEARSIRPTDEGVLVALELADLCRGPAVQADIARLQLRTLND